ncbi:MAG: hypothetical protein GC160_14385 [Acidobacteria bacterium]|nr:hypothetical protein [Acidobacteriota bacterium]
MTCRESILAAGLTLASCTALQGQALPQARWPEGFTKASPEHMVTYEANLVCQKRLLGRVHVLEEKTEAPGRAGVLIEVKRDRADEPLRIWRTVSKSGGKFGIRGLEPSDYVMKVMLDGFQSHYQAVRISPECRSDRELVVDLRLGL